MKRVHEILGFLLISLAVFWVVFGPIGAGASEWFKGVLGGLSDRILPEPVVENPFFVPLDLIVNGITPVVVTLLGFLPQVIMLFFAIELFGRGALFSRFRTPILGFGCTTMAIGSAERGKIRRRDAVLLSFIPCSAKMPIMTVIANQFFGMGFLVIWVLYLVSVAIGVAVYLVIKKLERVRRLAEDVDCDTHSIESCGGAAADILSPRSSSTPLEGLRNPWEETQPTPKAWEVKGAKILVVIKDTSQSVFKNTAKFLRRISAPVLIAATVIYFLSAYDFSLEHVDGVIQDSILYGLAGWVAPIFVPIGLASPVIVTALIIGLLGKEMMVVALALLAPAIGMVLSPAAALAFIIFALLYPVCVTAMAATANKFGWRFTMGLVGFNLAVAYIAAFVVYSVF